MRAVAARFFVDKFPGRSLYAVKANPSPSLLQILWEEGIYALDVASIGEVRLVHETLPEAILCFMHPVKAEEAVAEAYFEHGVKTFSLDTIEELDKIVRATSTDGVAATDLNLLVRLQVNNEHAKLSLGAKFGAQYQDVRAPVRCPPGVGRTRHMLPRRQPDDVAGRLCRSRRAACATRSSTRRSRSTSLMSAAVSVDLSRHGAPCSRPISRSSTRPSKRFRSATRPNLRELDVLCAEYASLLAASKSAAAESFTSTTVPMALCSTPLTSAGVIRFSLSVKTDQRPATWTFSFYGPTCDDLDHMTGPFALPRRRCRRPYRSRHARRLWLCDAHGFQRLRRERTEIVDDEPMATLYGAASRPEKRSNVVTLKNSFRSGERTIG